ncbi:MAG: flavodoxin family protein [Lentihominibacter sp.]|jgi:multimeric flavodoxin WrbA
MGNLILGINGSPRANANTEFLLEIALREAKKKGSGNITTEMINLRDYEINPCAGCFCCTTNAKEKGGERACAVFNDGMDDIYPKLLECKGLIVASPVYFGSVNAQIKAFMDRTEPLLRYGASVWSGALRDKVGAGIAMGSNRNGGQEFTIQTIHYFMFVHDMTVVGTGPDEMPTCYLGGVGNCYPERGRVKDAASKDMAGIRSCEIIGRRIAEKVLQVY